MRAVCVLAAFLLAVACTGTSQPTPTSGSIFTPDRTQAVQPTPTSTPSPSSSSSPTATPTSTAAIDPSPTPYPTARATVEAPPASAYTFEEFDVPAGSHPHDVAPAPDGSVWYTAQNTGRLGRLDPVTGEVAELPLGAGSAPHGVIVGPDGAAWITDGGLNAIVRVAPVTPELRPADNVINVFTLPSPANANLNTATFDGNGVLWFTGQAGVYGRVVPSTAQIEVFDAPRGPGPYGIDSTPAGDVWFVSLAGSYLAQIDTATGDTSVIDLPTPGQGARRVWSDSQGRLWISEWNAGRLAFYESGSGAAGELPLPGNNPMPYAVYVDEMDLVWLTDFGTNALVRYDPWSDTFESFPLPSANAAVRQLLGRDRELWGAESGVDKLVVLRRS